MSYKRGLQLAGFARRHLGRMRRGRHEVLTHLEDPRPETLPMPTFVQLRVTNLCNLRCKMCGQWGDSGIYRADGFSDSATDGEKERNRIRELIGARQTCGRWWFTSAAIAARVVSSAVMRGGAGRALPRPRWAQAALRAGSQWPCS